MTLIFGGGHGMGPVVKVRTFVILIARGGWFVVMISRLFVFFEAGLADFLLGDPSSGGFVLAVSHAGPDVDVGLIG
jgi:hypothetical protein